MTSIKMKKKKITQEYELSKSCLYSPVDVMFILPGLMEVIAEM